MRYAPVFKRLGYICVLVVLGVSQSGCSLFGHFSGASRGAGESAYAMQGFDYEIPTSVNPALSGGATQPVQHADPAGNALPLAEFSIQSFVKEIFVRQRASTPGSAPPDGSSPRTFASIKIPEAEAHPDAIQAQAKYCSLIDARLSSVQYQQCMALRFMPTGHVSNLGRPIMISHFDHYNGAIPAGRVLLLGGVHGNELSSVSIVFEWMQMLNRQLDREFVWDVVPVVNPDGLFHRPGATRTNARGVDLNRNMPIENWQGTAIAYWKDKTGSSPQKFPGPVPASEPETRWLVDEIERFQPDMIITVHAPYNLVDYDAPSRENAPRRFGRIKGGLQGTYPGSLGNYAGVRRGIPVVTIELPDSYKAIPLGDAGEMWADMLHWMAKTIPLENHRFLGNRYYAEAEQF